MTHTIIIVASIVIVGAVLGEAALILYRKLKETNERINLVHERIGDVHESLEAYKDVLGAQKALMEEDQRERALRKEKAERSKNNCINFYNGVKKRQAEGETLSAIAKSMGIRTKDLDEQMKKIENVIMQEDICVAATSAIADSLESNEKEQADEEKA